MTGADILHVTAHLGGGVGRVLLNYLKAAGAWPGRHRLMCLDYANSEASAEASAAGIELHDRLSGRPDFLLSAMAEAEIVVIHWWNHPLMYRWLTSEAWPPARVLLWSHVSGRAAPQPITPPLAAFPDLFAAASPVSLRLEALSAPAVKGRARLLFSTAGLERLDGVGLRPHQGFRAGYLGAVDRAKIHPDFIELCLSVGVEEAVFPVAGGPEHQWLRAAAEKKGVSSRFEILGPVSRPADFLAGLDVFGYPLNRDHYGTGEQVLIEAQAIGVPPVVLAGGAEEYVVEHEVTGLVASSERQYGRQVERLYRDEDLRQKLSRQAAQRAARRFGLDRLIEGFDGLYGELLAGPKRARRWPGQAPASPWELFLLSQGRAAALFEDILAGRPVGQPPPAFFSKTRGTVFHYADFFPEDGRLRQCRQSVAALNEDFQ